MAGNGGLNDVIHFETRGHLDQKENYINTSHVQRKHSSHAVKI